MPGRKKICPSTYHSPTIVRRCGTNRAQTGYKLCPNNALAGPKSGPRLFAAPRLPAGLDAPIAHAGEVLLGADARTTRRTFDAPSGVERPSVELSQLVIAMKVHAATVNPISTSVTDAK